MNSIKSLVRKERVKESKIDWGYRIIGISVVSAIMIGMYFMYQFDLFYSVFYYVISLFSRVIRIILSIFL